MNLKRALLVSGVVAGAAYIIKGILQKDIERYNSLATMSGDKPLFQEQMDKLKELVGAGARNGSN
ncbi:MAG: hypothetical protein NVS1B14_12870 [Vulcanimicrobiaceae bacterium]